MSTFRSTSFRHACHRKCMITNFYKAFNRPRVVARKPCLVKASIDLPEDFSRDIESSATLIDALVRKIGRDTLIEAASNYVSGDKDMGDAFRQRAVRSAIESRLEEMNDTFLMTLESYIADAAEQAQGDQGAQELLRILIGMKAEVLELLARQLPVEMQVINILLSGADTSEREKLLRLHTSEDAAPHCSLAVLQQMTSSLIIDMEKMPIVPDAALLAKLCLLREELDTLAIELGNGPTSSSSKDSQSGVSSTVEGTPDLNQEAVGALDGDEVRQRMDTILGKLQAKQRQPRQESVESNKEAEPPISSFHAFPAYTLGFIKEIMAVNSSEKRRALLTSAFKDGMSDTGTSGNQPPKEMRIGNEFDIFTEAVLAQQQELQEENNSKNVLLPGGFLQCLNTLQQELLRSAEGNTVKVEDGVLIRLEDVRRDAVMVLLDLAGEAKYHP